jgi:glycine/D-amino acid oxidase-like deaminating enzyme
MKLNSGLPFSLLRYGLPFNYPKLTSALSTEVVIVGGGISGALCAYYLTEAGIDCMVVDKRTIGLGSTAASTSLLQYEIDVSLNDLIKLRGERDAVRAYLLCNEAIFKLKDLCSRIGFPDFHPTDSLYYGVTKKDEQRLKDEHATRKNIGLDVRYLDSPELKKAYSIEGHGAILSKNAAYVDAYALTHSILQYSIKKGLKVFDRSCVKEERHKNGHVELTTENNIKIKSKHVIYATGYEVTEMLRKKIVNLISTYVTVSESMTDCNELPFHQTLLWNTADPYLYVRCTSDGRIIVGGRDDKFSNPARRDAAIKSKTKSLVNDFFKLFPRIDFAPEFSWAGTFGTTQDGLPFIGKQSSTENKYFALGFGGNGIVFSQIAAELLRDSILERKNPDEHLFGFDRL